MRRRGYQGKEIKLGDLVETTSQRIGVPKGTVGMVIVMKDNLVCTVQFIGDKVKGRKLKKVNRFNLKIVQSA